MEADQGNQGRPTSKEAFVGPYRLLKELGHGGQGSVYLAEDTRLGRRIALKVLSAGYALSATALLRFRAEAERAAKVNHPGLAQVYEWGGEGEQPYLAMEYVEGRTLAAHIADTATVGAPQSELSEFAVQFESNIQGDVSRASHGSRAIEKEANPVSTDEEARRAPGTTTTGSAPTSGLGREAIAGIVSMIEMAARALHAAHEAGLVHRDIKPGNLMLTKERGLVIIDFGLASDENAQGMTLTQSGDLLGTPAYMSPEQLTAQRISVDRRSDVYSLGVTLYECLALRRPFQAPSREQLYREILGKEAPNLHKLNPAVSEDLRVIVSCAMEKDADRRYQSALEFAEDLRRLRQHEPIRARPVGPAGRLLRWSQRNPAVAALLATVLIALSSGVIWTTLKNRELSQLNLTLEQTTAEAKLNAERAEAESAAKTVALESEQHAVAEKASALAEYERLADSRRLTNAKSEAETLWPVHPKRIPDLQAWQTKYAPLQSALPGHERALTALREQALPYTEEDRARDFAESLARIPEMEKQAEELSKALSEATEEPPKAKASAALAKLQADLTSLREEVRGQKSWSFGENVDLEFRHQTLSALVTDLKAAIDPKSGVFADIEQRLEKSRRIQQETVTQHAALWAAAAERITAHNAYGALELKPQTGLIPLGPDPTSGLEEFLHWQSHDWESEGTALPTRDGPKRMVMTEGRGLIMVLIPGGTFLMGAQKTDPKKPNHDPEARDNEGRVHEVPLAPYFLSKYEMTQGQWLRSAGSNPSSYGTGWENQQIQKGAVDARHPVEMVNWEDARSLLIRLDLELPTEAQWERAARAGGSTIWAETSDLAELAKFGNIAGAETAPYFPSHTAAHRDAFVIHAPVGTYQANGFGLHDMTGNVVEWCRDSFSDYTQAPEAGDGERLSASRIRVLRGGSFDRVASSARVALRFRDDPSVRSLYLGLRPSRRIANE